MVILDSPEVSKSASHFWKNTFPPVGGFQRQVHSFGKKAVLPTTPIRKVKGDNYAKHNYRVVDRDGLVVVWAVTKAELESDWKQFISERTTVTWTCERVDTSECSLLAPVPAELLPVPASGAVRFSLRAPQAPGVYVSVSSPGKKEKIDVTLKHPGDRELFEGECPFDHMCEEALFEVFLINAAGEQVEIARVKAVMQVAGVASSWKNSLEYGEAGAVKITVKRGVGLAPKDRTGKADPFVTFHFGEHTGQTSVIKQTLNPTWNESFIYPVDEWSTPLSIVVWDKDTLAADDFMGTAVGRPIRVYQHDTAFDMELELTVVQPKGRNAKKGDDKISGSILFSVHFVLNPNKMELLATGPDLQNLSDTLTLVLSPGSSFLGAGEMFGEAMSPRDLALFAESSVALLAAFSSVGTDRAHGLLKAVRTVIASHVVAIGLAPLLFTGDDFAVLFLEAAFRHVAVPWLRSILEAFPKGPDHRQSLMLNSVSSPGSLFGSIVDSPGSPSPLDSLFPTIAPPPPVDEVSTPPPLPEDEHTAALNAPPPPLPDVVQESCDKEKDGPSPPTPADDTAEKASVEGGAGAAVVDGDDGGDVEECNDATEILSGIMYKWKGGAFKRWDKRYFVLTPTALSYYPSQEKTSELRGRIPLSFVHDVKFGDDGGPTHKKTPSFVVVTSERTYTLSGASEQENRQWISALKTAKSDLMTRETPPPQESYLVSMGPSTMAGDTGAVGSVMFDLKETSQAVDGLLSRMIETPLPPMLGAMCFALREEVSKKFDQASATNMVPVFLLDRVIANALSHPEAVGLPEQDARLSAASDATVEILEYLASTHGDTTDIAQVLSPSAVSSCSAAFAYLRQAPNDLIAVDYDETDFSKLHLPLVPTLVLDSLFLHYEPKITEALVAQKDTSNLGLFSLWKAQRKV